MNRTVEDEIISMLRASFTASSLDVQDGVQQRKRCDWIEPTRMCHTPELNDLLFLNSV